MLALAVCAGAMLLLGLAVYLLDRPSGSAWLIPRAWQATSPGHWFGPAGPWLPSFVHAFAFSVFTAWCLPRRPPFVAAACLSWALVDTLAEIGQHAAVSAKVAAAVEQAFDGAALAGRVGRYFTQGSFDPADVMAGLAGCALAYLFLRRFLPSDHALSPADGPGRAPPTSNAR
jgi:hypothetical protein